MPYRAFELLDLLSVCEENDDLALRRREDDALIRSPRVCLSTRRGFEDFQHTLFHPDSGLDALDDYGFTMPALLVSWSSCYLVLCTK